MEQQLIRYIAKRNPALFKEIENISRGTGTTLSDMNFHLLTTLSYISTGNLENAEKYLQMAVKREQASKRFSPTVFSRGEDKIIFTFNPSFSQRFSAQTGLDLIVKRYESRKQVSWMNNYWTFLNQVVETDHSLPQGEITARTERQFILSVYFRDSNLCHDYLEKGHNRLVDRGIVNLLLQKNQALIPFTESFLKREGIRRHDERYAAKMGVNLGLLTRTSDRKARRRIKRAYAREKERFVRTLYDGAARVPFTDLKTPNIVLEADSDLSDVIAGRKNVRVIDDDKIDRLITSAHNIAHIIFDPIFALTFEERNAYLEQEGLLQKGKEMGTLLSVGYYLTRQVALMIDRRETMKKVEQCRLRGFYKSLKAILVPLSKEYRWAEELGMMLPEQPRGLTTATS